MADQPSIYIIDDDKFLLDMYALKFSDSGFAVSSASDARDALAKIEAATTAAAGQAPPSLQATAGQAGAQSHVILLDLVMPGLDGFGFLEALKAKNLQTLFTIIILSNLGQKEDIERGLSMGAQGYIVKASSTPSEVVEKVKQIMGGHKQ